MALPSRRSCCWGILKKFFILVVLWLSNHVRAATTANVSIRQRVSWFEVLPLCDNQQQSNPERSSQKAGKNLTKRRQKSRGHVGTKLDWRYPTPQRVARWFSATPSTRRDQDAAVKSLFNHKNVGMTNPMISVALEDDLVVKYASIPASSINIGGPGDDNSRTKGVARVPGHRSQLDRNHEGKAVDAAWWPGTVLFQNDSNQHKSQGGWRVLRLRRRVGRGLECYEQVRDAALAWSFCTPQQDQGIVAVPSLNDKKKTTMTRRQPSDLALNENVKQLIQPIWSGPHSRASRRLVTFTTCGFRSRWLPKFYAFNPVMVVYDILDQSGPGTTYTSTAYATMAGHLIRGEERVTVAMRDEGNVDVEIISFSRPGPSLSGYLAWPLLGNMQQRFFHNQLDHFSRLAQSAASTGSTIHPSNGKLGRGSTVFGMPYNGKF